LDPSLVAARNNLGAFFAARGEFREAADAFREAVRLDPKYAAAHSNLGLALVQSGSPDEGLAHAQLACDLAPSSAPIRAQLAQALLAAGQLEPALAALEVAASAGVETETTGLLRATILYRANRKADAIDAGQLVATRFPRSARAWRFVAHACRQLERRRESLEAFRMLSELDHASGEAAYFVSILEGRTPDRAAASYVREIFDGYADTFDRHLRDTLGYRVPEHLTGLLRLVVDGARRRLDVLDLGCGTGLCGAALRQAAAKLTGVDLSREMIRKAQERGLYDELVVGDLFDFLGAHERSWDLIVAGDVVPYIGDLAPLMVAVHRSLRSGGTFAFSTEASDGPSFEAVLTGRFVHGWDYVRRVIRQSGLGTVRRRRVISRTENNAPVWSDVVVCEARHAPM
jgi:predicted TPR repeat methyltransferase